MSNRPMSTPTQYWLACDGCTRTTRHLVLHNQNDPIFEDEDMCTGYIRWSIVQCQGCMGFSFLRRTEETYGTDFDGEPLESIKDELFPRRIVGRPLLKDAYFLPSTVRHIYFETRNALCNDMLVLAGIGIRALVEVVCKEKNAIGANLEKKIDSLVTLGLLTQEGATILHSLRIMGNQAAHEVKPHPMSELNIAFDVVEHLLPGLYILPKKAEDLPKP